MKYNNFFHICVEGCDGIGKNTLMKSLVKHYNFEYTIYDRGEISNFIYAKKFNRVFASTQRKFPMLILGLVCNDPQELLSRINRREYSSDDEHMIEEQKIHDNEVFKRTYEEFAKDFDIEVIDTTHKSQDEVLEEAIRIIDGRRNSIVDSDESQTTWNKMYDRAAAKYNIPIKVLDNQLYLNNHPILVESTVNQNGVYETFDNKQFPDNLLYSLAYDRDKIVLHPKEYDFTYVINSKIRNRPEIFEYYNAFIRGNKTCQISDNPDVVHDSHLIRIPARVYFEEAFLSQISKAKAAVYSARDLAYLELQTARLYESILTDAVVFVDKESDVSAKILTNIHGNDIDLIELLHVTPTTVCESYDKVFSDPELVTKILTRQHTWYNTIVDKFESDVKSGTAFTFN